MIFQTVEAIDFQREDLHPLPIPGHILMVDPSHYEVAYVINPHMEGHVGTVDPEEARSQWETLRATYEGLGLDVWTMESIPGLPDMVFCANQTLPYLAPDGTRGVFLSRMYAPQRQGEVPHLASFFDQHGFRIHPLPETLEKHFEGMGDAIWHPRRAMLWGGYGIRTDLETYPYLSEALGVPVVALELNDPDFYHLDTCLCVLDERTALYCPAAFTAEGIDLIHHLFDVVIEAPEQETRSLFACNAHCPDEQHVLIQQGCVVTCERLQTHGYTPVELNTHQFLKGGGSVFCMTLSVW